MVKKEAYYAEKIFDMDWFVDSVGLFLFILSDIRFNKRFLVAGTDHKGKEHRGF